MPHIILEHTPNIPETINIPNLLQELHETLSKLETFDLKAIKTRSVTCNHFLTGDQYEKPFVHITLALLTGRPDHILKQAGDQLFEILNNTAKNCKTSLEIRQMDPATYWK